MMHVLRVCALAALAALVLGLGCSVGFDENQADVFFCEDDNDCIAPQFGCNLSTNRCVRQSDVDDVDCLAIDVDRDGFTSDGNVACNNPGQIDCNDMDDTVHPGAVELCDGKDNNCDDTNMVDEPISCTNANFFDVCPDDGPEGTTPICNNGTCVVRSLVNDPMLNCNVISVCTDGSYVESGCP